MWPVSFVAELFLLFRHSFLNRFSFHWQSLQPQFLLLLCLFQLSYWIAQVFGSFWLWFEGVRGSTVINCRKINTVYELQLSNESDALSVPSSQDCIDVLHAQVVALLATVATAVIIIKFSWISVNQKFILFVFSQKYLWTDTENSKMTQGHVLNIKIFFYTFHSPLNYYY